MGLDIYYHRAKNKEAFLKYDAALEKFDDFETRYMEKHSEIIGAAYTVWNNWYDESFDHENDPAWAAAHPEPHYEFWDYLTPEEKTEKEAIEAELHSLRELAGYEEEELKDLYMRKKNWMVFYVQHRHPELIVDDERFGKILKDSTAVLDVSDIEELVDRMERILSNWHDFTGEESDENGFYTDEYKAHFQKLMDEHAEIAAELLPTGSRFFFGSTEYDCYYYTHMKRYLDEFKKELVKMRENGHVLIYRESW